MNYPSHLSLAGAVTAKFLFQLKLLATVALNLVVTSKFERNQQTFLTDAYIAKLPFPIVLAYLIIYVGMLIRLIMQKLILLH